MSEAIDYLPGQIDPFDPANYDKPLWCIYGPDCFPSIFCCKVLYRPSYGNTGPCIWGYSVYRREPGFRTLGKRLGDWLQEQADKGKVRFFDDHEVAIKYLAELIIPQCR